MDDSASDALREFAVKDGKTLQLKASSGNAFPGVNASTPVVSASGAKDGVVWVLRSKSWNGPDQPAGLYASDAANVVSSDLYSSEQNLIPRPRWAWLYGSTCRPLVNGHVYVGAKREVDVYGLLPAGR